MTNTSPPRDYSLDSFRGLDVLLMILVNVQGSDAAAFAFMKHAEWNGITLADFVFPVFLLIVGLSAPLALDRADRPFSWPGILKRVTLLFLIGVALGIAIRGEIALESIRWMGVLQRIAIVYLVCAVVIKMRGGIALPIVFSIGFLALHSVLLLFVGSPTGNPPSLAPGMGVSGWLDQNFIPGRVHRGTWDPEGILSTLPAVVNALIGVAIMRRIQTKGTSNPLLVGIGASLIIIGMLLTPWLPFNKNLWTAGFVLFTSGVGLVVWAAMRAVWPLVGHARFAKWIVMLGQTALTLYVVHMLLIAMLVRHLPDGTKIWDAGYNLLASTGLNPALASISFAVCAAVISCAAIPSLRRHGWVLKV